MLALLGLGGGEILILVVAFCLVPLGLAALAFWVWMLVEAIRNPGLTDNERIVWVLVIVLLQLPGAIIYFFAGHPKRKTPRAV